MSPGKGLWEMKSGMECSQAKLMDWDNALKRVEESILYICERVWRQSKTICIQPLLKHLRMSQNLNLNNHSVALCRAA